jgi:hypothetical protein
MLEEENPVCIVTDFGAFTNEMKREKRCDVVDLIHFEYEEETDCSAGEREWWDFFLQESCHS